MSLSPSRKESDCLEAFRAYVATVYRNEFGIAKEALEIQVAEDWFFCDERHEHRLAELRRRLPEARRILDLASGMGTAVLHALSQGFDAFGVEPDSRKLRFTWDRIDAGAMPAEWKSRFHRAVGEHLPFHNDSFDAVLSYQTIEHVQDETRVLREMLRVVRSGGALHIRCPDYRGTYEGHYQLPWLPLMPRGLVRIYLRLMGRPLAGFEGIRYATRKGIVKTLRAMETEMAGIHLEILDLERARFLNRLAEKGLPVWEWIYPFWKIFRYGRDLFRRELNVNLWVSVHKTAESV